MKKDLTLARLNNTDFSILYEKVINDNEPDTFDLQSFLALAVVFINSGNDYIQRLGYRMIVVYSNQTKDYHPLYEIALNMGLFPISKSIANMFRKKALEAPSREWRGRESFFTELNNAFMELYRKSGKYQSYAQKGLLDFFYKYLDSSVAVVAPTSYGKTELIIALLEECKNKNFCIITPTKSLLAQTKKRILDSKIQWVSKIVTHPEMYRSTDPSVVAVLTQERLLRLLRKAPELKFDYVTIDEAHGLLENDGRSLLLASAVVILQKRNPNAVFKFLTPFLNDTQNLAVRHTDIAIQSHKVSEYLKTERYYLYDADSKILRLYDQFLDRFFELDHQIAADEVLMVKRHSVDKNIIYLNKPLDIEKFSMDLSPNCSPINSASIIKACKAIKEYMHPDYKLIYCLSRGVIYHHGSVPDLIRLYIEYLYSNIPELRYVVTSSTLLEGVNLPAKRMFILDNKKGNRNLSPSNFQNLVGRICRFGDIFNEENQDQLGGLEPHVYLVKGEYYSKNANLDNFIKKMAKVDRLKKDDPKNVLLQATPIEDKENEQLDNAREFIENYENNTIEQYQLRYAKTETGKSCFLNNITELPIFEVESTLQTQTERLRVLNLLISDSSVLMDTINELFLSVLDNDRSRPIGQNIIRLKNEQARTFYSMFLRWRIEGVSYSQMIESFLSYWRKIDNSKGRMDPLVFVGRWGDTTRGGRRPLWTDIRTKDTHQRVNLAIVRIKEEQDFLDNTVMKFVEVLNDLEFVEEGFYNQIKYGTDDSHKIILVKNGFSLSLSNLLVDKYPQYIELDGRNQTADLRQELISAMIENCENEVLINEARYFVPE